jgi:hypothetical protein
MIAVENGTCYRPSTWVEIKEDYNFNNIARTLAKNYQSTL